MADPQVELARAEWAWDNGGQCGAMLAALEVCREHTLPLPEWLNAALADFLSAAVLQAGSRRAEAFRRWLRRRRADLIDLERAMFFAEALNHGLTWDDAGAMTADYYTGTPAGGCTTPA